MLTSARSATWGSRIALILILAVSFGLMLKASLGDSAIDDELAHIPAGYGYVHNLDYRLNPEHPPLLKALAGIPLLFKNLNFPTQSRDWTDEVNGQWAMGAQFLYGSGNDATSLIRWARLFPMLLTLALIVLVYLWSAELMGRLWALVPAFLTGLSPTVIAHGHYVTTDIAAAFGILLAAYGFIRFLKIPSKKNLFLAGIMFGVAQIAKFSAVLIIPYFLALIVIFYIVSVANDWASTMPGTRARRFGIRLWRYLRGTVLIFIIGYVVVVYPVYFLFTAHYPQAKQISDTTYILQSFGGGPTAAGTHCAGSRCLADLNIWMTKHASTRPVAEYMLGVLMVLQRASGGNTAYFLGHVSSAGSRLYFPLVYLMKESLPSLLLTLLAGLYGLARICKGLRRERLKNMLGYLTSRFPQFAMAFFIIFYWAYSMRSPLNIGFRHLMPTIPFMYILAVSGVRQWVMGAGMASISSFFAALAAKLQSLGAAIAKIAVVGVLLVWLAAETAFAAPYFLSYFNELAGGVSHGYRYVTDSNYDWGQDMLRLQQWVGEQNAHCALVETTVPCGIDKIAVDYFGGSDPLYYLGAKAVRWSSAQGNPADKDIHWLAVSINSLQGATEPTVPGEVRNPQDEYRWLTALRPTPQGMGNVSTPDYRVGTTLFIYHL